MGCAGTGEFLTEKNKTIREIKLHAYGKRQTADSSCEFLKQKMSSKTALKIHMYKKLRKITNLCVVCVEVMNSSKAKGKLGHLVQIHICCLT